MTSLRPRCCNRHPALYWSAVHASAAGQAAAPVRVSVLMRVLAGEGPAVARSLASLRSQRLRDWEIVAAATPPAAASLRALHASEMRVVELDVDQGPAVAYERCRALAAGELLVLLAPGETLAPFAFAKAVTLLDGSEDAPVVSRRGKPSRVSPFWREKRSPPWASRADAGCGSTTPPPGAVASRSLPSVATGLHPRSHGVVGALADGAPAASDPGFLADTIPTFAEHAEAAGITTVGVSVSPLA